MRTERHNLIHTLGMIFVCLGILAPLNVLYHEVRFFTGQNGGPETDRIAEFESYRDILPAGQLTLVEPKDIDATEHMSRLLQAQFALAPVVVTWEPVHARRIVNKRADRPSTAVARETPRYVLIDPGP